MSLEEKKKPKRLEQKICNVCGGKYCTSTKYNHFGSEKHKRGIEFIEKDKKLKELEDKFKILCDYNKRVKELEHDKTTRELYELEIKTKDTIIEIKDKEITELKNTLADITNEIIKSSI